MVNMDQGAPGYRRSKPASKQDLKRLKKGGQQADAIKRKKEAAHKQEEAQAEQQLQQDLSQL